MALTFHIHDTSNPKVRAFLAFIKTLDFVVIDNPEKIEDLFMSDEEIVKQALVAEDEVKYGKTKTHAEFYKEFKKWR